MSEALPCTLISWEEVYDLCRRLAAQLRASGYRIDTIVAIARGGYVPGRILSDLLGIHDLTGFKIEHYQGPDKSRAALVKYPLNADVSGKNILLLDDVSDSGDTFAVGIEHLRQCGTPQSIRTAALHYKTVSRFVPDYFVGTLDAWRWLIYPWAINEDLAAIIARLPPGRHDLAALQALIRQRHTVEVSLRQIEDALLLVEGHA